MRNFNTSVGDINHEQNLYRVFNNNTHLPTDKITKKLMQPSVISIYYTSEPSD